MFSFHSQTLSESISLARVGSSCPTTCFTSKDDYFQNFSLLSLCFSSCSCFYCFALLDLLILICSLQAHVCSVCVCVPWASKKTRCKTSKMLVFSISLVSALWHHLLFATCHSRTISSNTWSFSHMTNPYTCNCHLDKPLSLLLAFPSFFGPKIPCMHALYLLI